MPTKPKKPCAYPGCPNLTFDVYCEEHAALRRKQYDKLAGLQTTIRNMVTTGDVLEGFMLRSIRFVNDAWKKEE